VGRRSGTKVNGELSAEDFATLKETMMQQLAKVEAQLNALMPRLQRRRGFFRRPSVA
jgi:hypothetical protein